MQPATGKNWTKKYQELKDDVVKIFNSRHHVQGVFISEFGNMFDCVDKHLAAKASTTRLTARLRTQGGVPQPAVVQSDTESIFQTLVKEIGRKDIVVEACPPYVALLSTTSWSVVESTTTHGLCTREGIFAQAVHLAHKLSSQKVTVYNSHIPSTAATHKMKTDVVETLMRRGDEAMRTGSSNAWILGGDCNFSKSQLMTIGSHILEPSKEAFSTSCQVISRDAQKSDVAVS
jgi:hypothetical protein